MTMSANLIWTDLCTGVRLSYHGVTSELWPGMGFFTNPISWIFLLFTGPKMKLRTCPGLKKVSKGLVVNSSRHKPHCGSPGEFYSTGTY